MNKMEKMKKNTAYGIMAESWNADLARELADRAIQQTVDADELRARVGDLIDPEIVDMACTIIDEYFMKQSDETDDFLDFLMSDKSIWEAFPGQAVES